MNNSLKINAWLERSDPLVEFLDTNTGNVVLSIHGSMLHEILATANLSHDELFSDKHALIEFIDELFSSHVSDRLGVSSQNSERRKTYVAEVIEFPNSVRQHQNINVVEIKQTQIK